MTLFLFLLSSFLVTLVADLCQSFNSSSLSYFVTDLNVEATIVVSLRKNLKMLTGGNNDQEPNATEGTLTRHDCPRPTGCKQEISRSVLSEMNVKPTHAP